MTRHVDQLAAHVRRLGNDDLNELLVQLPTPASPPWSRSPWPGRSAGRAGAAVRAGPRRGRLDGGGRCAPPAAGHPDPRPRPGRPGGLAGLDPGRRPGPLIGASAGGGAGDAAAALAWVTPASGARCLALAAHVRALDDLELNDLLVELPVTGSTRCWRPPSSRRGRRHDRRPSAVPAAARSSRPSEFYRRRRGRRLSPYCQPCTRAASREARSRRRQDPAAAEQLRAVDRARQRRRRALGGQGGAAGDRPAGAAASGPGGGVAVLVVVTVLAALAAPHARRSAAWSPATCRPSARRSRLVRRGRRGRPGRSPSPLASGASPTAGAPKAPTPSTARG